MPVALVGVAAAAGSVAAAGGIAAVSAGIMAGSMAALAAGAMVVGSALTIAGKLTGSKTLGKIGMGFTLAGGIGSLAAGARGATGAAASAEGSAAARAADLSTTEGLLASKTPGVRDVIAENAFKTFGGRGGSGLDSAAGALESGSNIGNYATEASLFERFNTNLTKYNGAINVAGGVADAYMQTRGIQAQEDISDKNREESARLADRSYSGTSGTLPQRQVEFNPVSQGLLRGRTTIPNVIPSR